MIKIPSIIILYAEFCQYHKLSNPKYVLRSNDGKSYWFDCIIKKHIIFASKYIFINMGAFPVKSHYGSYDLLCLMT